MTRRRIYDAAIMFLVAGGLLLAIAGPALAHVDFQSSNPADGDVLTEPLERIELVFTGAAEPVPGGIQLIDETRPLEITVFQPSDDTVVVEAAEPLGDGRYALIWAVESEADGHRAEGTIYLTVAIPGGAPQEDTSSDINTPRDEPPAATTTAAASVVTTTSLPMVSERLPAAAFETTVVAPPHDEAAGKWIARIGRWAMMAGALLSIGSFVFAGTALTGSEHEVRLAVGWMRRGGVLVILGTIVEVAGEAMMRAGTLGDALSQETLVDLLAGSFGIAVLLRLAGGIALLQDPRLAATTVVGPVRNGPDDVQATGLAAGEDATAVITAPPIERFRLNLGQETVAFVGVLAVAASFMFDGHTASVEPAVVAKGASFIHVLAAGVWFGGLVVMATTLTRRWRSGIPLDAAPMAIRFSRAAAVALAVAAAAGIALTGTILDSPGDLLSSTWGRVLLAKVALVVAVAAAGGYNHFKIVPAFDEDATNPQTSERLRKVVRLEAELLIVVVALTAILVGAAP